MDVVLVSSALGVVFYVAASTDGGLVLRPPPSPVFTGDDVILYCQYEQGNLSHTRTSFFKNGAEVNTSGGRAPQMILSNVTQDDQAFYSCASRDRKLQSPDTWLTVRPDRGNVTTEETPISSNDSWKWMVVCSGLVLVLLSPLAVWLLCHCRTQRFSTGFKQEVPAEALPATKQDVTEVQWDLSWMEMSNLLDKETLNCGS